MVVVLLVAMLMLPQVAAVIIHGSVYDIDLNKVDRAILVVNTTPEQTLVITNGTYAFEVPKGSYSLHAHNGKQELDIVENISATEDGDYVLDLIMLPSFEKEQALLAEDLNLPSVDEFVQDQPRTNYLVWILAAAVIVMAVIVYRIAKHPRIIKQVKKEVVKEVKEVVVSDDLRKIMQILDREGGRTTQKEIRKEMPYSEAKISLLIDELEGKNLAKRIKKGRGNIIVRV